MEKQVEEINKKALNSGKYLILFGILSSFFSFGVSAILGRISPDLLGNYSMIISFLNLTTTIVCMGGATILSRFVIREKNIVNRSRVFYTYCYLTLFVLIIFSILLLLFPSIYNFFIGDVDRRIRIFSILIMMPLYTSVTVVSYFLTSILESKISKIMGNLYVIGMFILCLLSYFFAPIFYINNFYEITFAVIFLTNLLSLLIGVKYIVKNRLLVFNYCSLKPLVYKSAVIFTFCTIGQAILSYLSTNFDKVFLGNLSGMGQLGYYQAISQIVLVVELIPNLLGNVTIPYFSAVIEKNNKEQVKKTYLFLERMIILFLASIVFALIGTSKICLLIFGDSYVNYYPALVLLLASKLIASRGFLNTPMMVNLDLNILRLMNSIFQVFLQIIIMLFATPILGIYGVVFAKIIGQIFAQIIPQLKLKHSQFKIDSSRQYWMSVITVCILVLIFLAFDLNIFEQMLFSFIMYSILLLGGGYSIKEILRFINIVIKNRER